MNKGHPTIEKIRELTLKGIKKKEAHINDIIEKYSSRFIEFIYQRIVNAAHNGSFTVSFALSLSNFVISDDIVLFDTLKEVPLGKLKQIVRDAFANYKILEPSNRNDAWVISWE